MKRILLSLLALLFLMLLLLSPATSLEGARNGLLLWAYTVLPTLLPFMIGTGMIVSLGAVHLAMRPFSPLLSFFFHFSEPAGFAFITGLLCGYPMGAKMDRDLLENGQITATEANCLLAICNHPSPMFLTGYTTLESQKMFPASAPFPLPIFLLSLYLPVFPIFFLARHYYQKNAENTNNICISTNNSKAVSNLTVMPKTFSLDDHLFKPALMGFLEITTGIRNICEHASGLSGLLLVTASVSFGGISGIFQTRSVLMRNSGRKNAGLSIRHYIFWKALHSLLSCIFLLILWKLYASSFFSS